MGFDNVAGLVDAELAGKTTFAYFRKVPAVATVAGGWLDYSMIPGSPPPQYYAAAPLLATTLTRSSDGGIRHGGDVSPSTKYLRTLTGMVVSANGVPQRILLLDYCLFYPFCDMGTTDAQTMTNTATLTRHATGDGLQIMAVLVAPHGMVGDSFTVSYTNQAGVAGRSTGAVTMTTGVAVNGTILTTQSAGAGRIGPFLPLQTGDTGVRSIESVTCTAGSDVGLFTLVLVKPIAEWTIRGIDAPTEVDFLLSGSKLPVVADDAYLNFITCPAASLSGIPLNGYATFVWD